MHLHASNWQHKFYFQHYTTPRDVPKQHSINSYLIPPLELRLPRYLPASLPPSLLLHFLHGEKEHRYVFQDLLLVHARNAGGNERIHTWKKKKGGWAAALHVYGVCPHL